jgi:N6-L-threonylcarbamoyladenine synthase
MMDSSNFDFSFAGLKTATLYWLKDHAEKQGSGYRLQDTGLHDFCASFEQAAVDVLASKTKKALDLYAPKTLIVAGGVSANKKLRQTLQAMLETPPLNHELRTPNLQYCMDNAAMIAVAGYYGIKKKKTNTWKELVADPNWKIYDKK